MVQSKISFGFKAVVAGQKASVSSADPQLTVASTPGKFTITPAVSSLMGLVPGEYIQFADNVAEIEAAIRNRQPELVEWANENGLDINTAEGAAAVIKEFRLLGIFKGVALLDSKGEQRMANARTSKEEKVAYAAEHRDEIVAMLAENGTEATEENILAAVGSKQEPAFSGSKLASTTDMTGTGLALSFTDSNVWNVLKADVEKDIRTKMKRVFDVDVKNTIKMPFNNGFEDVEVEVFPLINAKNEEVSPREKK